MNMTILSDICIMLPDLIQKLPLYGLLVGPMKDGKFWV
ncbi:unnamed protein product [Enterobius vermicularis]|uniref:Uncharacterized protein n=1 Tax=Enterobius vermicularis TaxID=51028 RepID=A0A0N4VRP5_ENTVE|nr:unnamed protein product [Enterobius vermicularis]